MEKINWGIIGCGDVTELKSGPAFNIITNSRLVAVMRRDLEKAKDYAIRHKVPKWYSDANLLINDPEINAIYIATPPAYHEEFALAAFNAGKPVYVEKPMALNYFAATNMAARAALTNTKFVVAHYRREQPFYKKIKQLLEDKVIGEIKLVHLNYLKKALTTDELLDVRNKWRVDPAVSGGGLFHDIAPHQLDIMYHLFGPAKIVYGTSCNQGGFYKADDTVSGNILFENGVMFIGMWSFGVPEIIEKDECEIIGTKGKISFSFFGGNTITITLNGEIQTISFDSLQHVQQPMLEKVVSYFLGFSDNPCSGNDGALIMYWMEKMTEKQTFI